MLRRRPRGPARARALAEKLAAEATPAERAPTVAPLVCPTCSAPVPLGTADVASCVHCATAVPLPEAHRALRAAEHQHAADRAEAEALYRTLGKPPGPVLRAWTQLTAVAGGTLAAIVIGLLYVSAGFALLAGFALELVLHALAGPLGIDFIDRFGGGTTYAAFALGVVLLGLAPRRLETYLDLSGALRRALQASLAARPPERPGFPSTCRGCGAALEVAAGALGVRCAYCQADNLVALPAAWVAEAGVRQDAFHRSIVDAAARARALRAEARAGLPRFALWSAAGVIGFGLLGRGCTALDLDHELPDYATCMGPPRAVITNWDSGERIPIDTELAYKNISEYTAALRDGETFVWSASSDTACTQLIVRNTTSFPLLTKQWEAACTRAPDGRYVARFEAPYTGLFQLKIEGEYRAGAPPARVRWQAE